jgi:hypothetical protein
VSIDGVTASPVTLFPPPADLLPLGSPAETAPAPDEPAAPPAPVGLRELIGRNVRRLRLEGLLSTEDLARAARHYGLTWTAAWLGAVERGQKPVSAEQLLALPVVLSDALGHRVALADLLLGDEPVRLTASVDTPHAPVSAGYLREVVTAPPYRRAFAASGSSGAAPNEPTLARAAAKMREISRAGLGNVDVRALNRAEAGAGEVEERLARRLAVPTIVLIAAAASLWGRSVTEERAARLAPPDPEAPEADLPKPTAVMRRLTAQLAARLEAAAREAAGREAAAGAVPQPPPAVPQPPPAETGPQPTSTGPGGGG